MAFVAYEMFLTDVCVCLPLTLLLIAFSCRVILQSKQVPVIYYTNLLITTLLQLCAMIALVANAGQVTYDSVSISVYAASMMANLGFKACIALERLSAVTCQLLDFIRHMKGSVVACVVIWILCIVTVCLAVEKVFLVSILALFFAPLFILFLAGSLMALPAATSVPVDEKRRIMGAVVLLFLNYFVMIFPMITLTLHARSHQPDAYSVDAVLRLFLLSPFADLILFVFMWKGWTDRLLAYLCCCISDVSAASAV
ncbi:uncharacterized protein LOC115793658 [Archocentrus centrarchus]|uniref:uncharacterized protein LOC115793658 n=1 Tax=Archocentrus centrarchus TaxID=63155 RepID=UPI0011E9C8B2|nr:uncharacterized protein LOC115793658 [Archocentrus centrarchus]XP_030604591.1 uncharacterized protein LOC115793658 [Archocentrus centrarchus]XP_030604592.1 uncharacterized protein LOC115793658 [Archocentrus centrarchus]